MKKAIDYLHRSWYVFTLTTCAGILYTESIIYLPVLCCCEFRRHKVNCGSTNGTATGSSYLHSWSPTVYGLQVGASSQH